MKYRILPLPFLALTSLAFAQGQGSPKVIQLQGTQFQGQAGQAGQNQQVQIWLQIPKLKLGDKAPELKPAKWVKGQPVNIGAGRVTVVNFWATWSGPCHQAFPTLADLAQRYKGKVDFVGVSVMEPTEDVETGVYARNVDAFVQMQGARMPYTVALDDAKGTIATNWLANASQTIPSTFIIDRAGKVAWVGHPLADLGEVLPKVVAGTYNTAKAAAERSAQMAAEGQLQSLIVPIQSAMSVGNEKEAVTAIDRAIAKNRELEVALGPTRFQMQLHFDEPGAYVYAKNLAEGACKNSAASLNLIAWAIVEDGANLKQPDYPTALAIAKRASELTQHSDPYILDTYALATFRNGDRDKALELQERAVILGENRKGIDKKILGEMKERLAKFKKALNP